MTKRESKVMRSFQIKMMTQLAQGKFDSVDLKNDLFVKWLVSYMAKSRVPFKLIPMGGGVTRIVHSGGLCPLCCGTGMIHADVSEVIETPDPASLISELAESSCCGGSCADGGPCCKAKETAA